jgi:hypothetical protein
MKKSGKTLTTPSKAFLRTEVLAAQAVKHTNFCIKEQKNENKAQRIFRFRRFGDSGDVHSGRMR